MMKKNLIKNSVILIAITALSISIAEGGRINMAKPDEFYVTCKIDRVISGDSLKLADGRIIKLLGINTAGNDDLATRLIQDLTKGKSVIVVYGENNEQHSNYAYLYIWNLRKDKIPPYIDSSNFEYRGFLNVEDKYKFLNGLQKGLAVFLNATIIKCGYAKVDDKANFRLKETFKKIEREAKEGKRGIWANIDETH